MNKISTIFSVVIVSVVMLVGNFILVDAGTGGSMSGYAWSDNIGWMSFSGTGETSCAEGTYDPQTNEGIIISLGMGCGGVPEDYSTICDNQPTIGESCSPVGYKCHWGYQNDMCSPVPFFMWYECVVPPGVERCSPTPFSYGVNIGTDGAFSGYAWSDNIGWIDFAPTSGYPEAPNHGAKLEEVGGVVTGWARALSNGGGWDGWIKMSGVATDGSSYGVDFNNDTKIFEGYAWGSDVVGWLEFDPIEEGGGGGGDEPSTCLTCGVTEIIITAVDDTANVNENSSVNIYVLLNDIPGDATIVDVTTPEKGTADFIDNYVRYSNTGGVGTDTFTYKIEDSLDNQDTATVTVTIHDCGDGTIDSGEVCDAGVLNGICREGQEVCNSDCSGTIPQCEPLLPEESVCSNTVCELNENFFNCPQDCPATFEEF